MRIQHGAIALALLLAVALAVVVLLPDFVRGRLEARIEALTSRATTIADVDLDLFARRLVVHDLRVHGAAGEPSLAAVTRIDARFHLLAFLVRGAYVLDSAEIVRPVVHVVRTDADRFNVSALLDRLAEPDRGPSVELRVAQATIADGWIGFEDRTVSPPVAWAAQALSADVTSLSTEVEDAPGTVTSTFSLAGAPGTLAAREVHLRPMRTRAELSLQDLPVGDAWRYVPADAALRPAGGTISVRAVLVWDARTGLRFDSDGRLTGLTLHRRDQSEPWIVAPTLTLVSRDVVYHQGRARAGRLEVAGDATVVTTGASPPQRIALDGARAIVTDAAVPGPASGTVSAEAGLPDGGRLEVRGDLDVWPFRTRLVLTVSDVPLVLVDPHLPAGVFVRIDGGRVDGDLVLALARDGAGVDGTLTARDLTLRRHGQREPFVRAPALHATIGLVARDGTVALERLVAHGSPTIVDGTVTPPQRYALRRMSAIVEHVGWPPRGAARVSVRAETEHGATSAVEARIDLASLETEARVDVAGLPLDRLEAYLPPGSAVRLGDGRLAATVKVLHAGAEQRLTGRGRVEGLTLRRRGEPVPFLTSPDAAVAVDDLVIRDGALAVGRLTVDVGAASLALAGFGLDAGSVRLERATAVADGLTLPAGAGAPVRLDAMLAGGGTLAARGTLTPGSPSVDLAVEITGADAAAFHDLIRVGDTVRGRLDAGLRLTASLGETPDVTVAGDAIARDLAVVEDGRAPVSAGRVVASAIETGWPPRLSIAELTIDGPSALVERAADGSFPLRALLAPRRADDGNAAAAAASRGSGPAAASGPNEARRARIPLSVGRLTIHDGEVRFIDRTVTPVYAETISDLSLGASNLVTDPEHTADVVIQGSVGGTAALALHGTITPFGEPFALDVRGTLRDFPAPRTNPYVRHHTAYAIRQGEVRTEVHYRIVGDELTAINRLLVEDLAVQRTDATARVEIPLGLVVSLLKDTHGDIRLTVPVEGRVGAPGFDFGRAIGQAFKNALARLVTAPLRAIGQVFSSPDDGTVAAIAVDPVPFPAGSATLTPEAERHLHQVADVLRASPFVALRLTAPVTLDDVASLVAEDVATRIARRQHEAGSSFEAAARALFAATFPDRAAPDRVEAVVEALRASAPVSDVMVRALAERRLAVTRQALVEQAGVEPERLGFGPEPVAAGATGTPRVELALDS